MAALPLPFSSAPGIKPQESAGRLINAFAEKTDPGARSQAIWKRTPGLRELISLASHIHLRGAILVNTTLVSAFNSRVYAITVSGDVWSASNLGALAGTDAVTIAKNNAATPNILCVSSGGCFNLFVGSAPTAFADADLPQPNSVSELAGYFLWTIGDGRIFASGLNAVTVSTSAFTTEQSAGGLLRGVTFQGEFWAFGANGIGVYRDAGLSPFPLERHPFTIQRGICGTHAVAGWEPGWINELLWAGDNGVVYRMNGYVPEPVSSTDVTRIVQQSIRDGEGSVLEASAYTVGLNAFWSLTNPGIWTWDYSLTTKEWHERKSFGRDDCRASRAVRAFNRWIAGDRTTGKLFEVDATYYREGADPLIMTIESGAAANFPARLGVPRADFDFTAAVGSASGEDPIQTDPSVLISWSNDGGYRWGNPVMRRLGPEGESRRLVTVLRTGVTTSKGKRFRMTVSDPVHVTLAGAQFPAEQRAE